MYRLAYSVLMQGQNMQTRRRIARHVLTRIRERAQLRGSREEEGEDF